MASSVQNTASPYPLLTRGRPYNLGPLTSATQVWAFSIPEPNAAPNGLEVLTLATSGGTATSPAIAIEVSIDGGNNWFTLAQRTGTTVTNAAINSDTAVTTVGTYDVSGLQGALFRVGISAYTSGTFQLWALIP